MTHSGATVLDCLFVGQEKRNVQVEIQKVCPEWPEGFLKVAPRMDIWWDLGVRVGDAVSQER